MTIYPGARHPPAGEQDRVDHNSAREYVWHARHFWRMGGCYLWVTTVRVRGGGKHRILGEHVQ